MDGILQRGREPRPVRVSRIGGVLLRRGLGTVTTRIGYCYDADWVLLRRGLGSVATQPPA